MPTLTKQVPPEPSPLPDKRGRAAASLAVASARHGWALAAALLLAVSFPSSAAGGAPPARAQAEAKPEVLLMTALPLIWGEGGAFDPASKPAAVYTAWQREFTLHPIDALDAASLSRARLLLLIQPRWLGAEELVALDAWVRGGGRALILADPRLNWHSDLPLGDIRRPPPTTLLKPLLSHWGLSIEPGDGIKAVPVDRGRLLQLEHPGVLRATGACKVDRPFLARCRLGSGRAIILADADLLRDELWMGEGPQGEFGHRRTSDNPLVVADLLDELAGIERQRVMGDASWRNPHRRPLSALPWILLPLLAIALAAAAAWLLRRRKR